MLQARITLGLQATLILFVLGVVHMTGSVLSGLGIISDIFVVLGAIQTGRFFINEDLRYDVSEFLGELLNLNDISEGIVDIIDEVVEEDFEEVDDEELGNVFKSMFFVSNDDDDDEDLADNPMIQTNKEEILEERKV